MPTIGDAGTPVIAGAGIGPGVPNAGEGMLFPGVTTVEPPSPAVPRGPLGAARSLVGPSVTSPPALVGTTPAAESRAATPARLVAASLALLPPRVQAANAIAVAMNVIARLMSLLLRVDGAGQTPAHVES